MYTLEYRNSNAIGTENSNIMVSQIRNLNIAFVNMMDVLKAKINESLIEIYETLTLEGNK